jgi:hypothetical protein
MTDADRDAVHRAALAALREVAQALAVETPAAALPRLVTVAAGESREVEAMAQTYLYAARVGGNAAEPERAMLWLTGWSAARTRTWAQAQTAVTEGIRFAERLHRSLGIPSG